jgi:hypothetical protein
MTARLRTLANFEQRVDERHRPARRLALDDVQRPRERTHLTARPSCALRILDAATICIALVIWAVLLTDLMRRRSSRGLLT